MLDFDKAGGVVPAIAQDADTGRSAHARLDEPRGVRGDLRTGRACYFSRSRSRLWRKGEESGHVQEVEASTSIATPTRSC